MEFTAKQIAAYIGGEVVGDENATVCTFAKIEEGAPGALSFLANPKYTDFIYETNSSVVLVNNDFVPERPVRATLVKSANAYESLAKLMENQPCDSRKTFGDVCIQYRESTRHFARTLPRIPEAVARIREQACSGLTAADVADFIGGARRTAEAHFRLATGHSILQEIQSVRLERVFALLSASDMSISDLTELCGYSTPQALRKAFRLHAGISMNDWRKRKHS